MEGSAVLFIVAVAVAYYFYRRHERLSDAVRCYSSALAERGIDRAYREEDDAEGLRLQRLADALRRAKIMTRKEWVGQSELLVQTLSAVREATRDDVLAAVDLRPGRPGYDASKEAAEAMIARLERMR